MRARNLVLVLVMVGAPCLSLAAPAPRTGPPATTTASPAPELAGKVTVVSVVGNAHKLVTTGTRRKWVPLKRGEALDELTLIRTGLRTKVVLRFADRAQVVVNNASKMGIGEFRKRGNFMKARVGLKYGTIRATIEKGRGPNDFRVATPVATLSVTGSGADIGALIDSPMVVQSFSGAWKTTTSAGEKTVLAGEATNQTLTQWADLAKQTRETTMASAGQTDKEKEVLLLNKDGRGIIGLTPTNSGTGLPIITPPPIIKKRCPPTPPPPVPPPKGLTVN